MKKEDIDLYLNNIRTAKSDSERLALTKEFYAKINKSIVGVKQNRNIYHYDLEQDILNYMVETGALSTLHEIAAGRISDLSRCVGFIADRAEVPNKETEREKIASQIDKLLQDSDIFPEKLTISQVVLLDGLLTRKVYSAILDGKPVDDITVEASKKLFRNLPEGKTHRATLLYQKQIFRVMNEREDVRNLIPKLPANEYRELLAKFKKSTKDTSHFDYDNTLYEFLSLYGDTEEVSLEEKHELFSGLASKFRVGRLMNSDTYTKYFMGINNDDNARVLYGNQDILIRDVLARIYENDGADVRTTDAEKELFDMFFLPKEHDMSVEDPQFYEEMKSKYEDFDPKFTYDGILKEMLSELFLHSSDNWVDVTRYMMRLKKIFLINDRPKEEFLAKVYDYATSLDVYDELKKNLTPKALREYGPEDEVDVEKIAEYFGIEYTEEERKRREDLKKWKEENDYDPNVNYYGLRRIDCADIALELMLEADYRRAISEFTNPENIANFRKYGRDLYNSRAVRKLVEMYVDEPAAYDLNFRAEIVIKEFVDKVSSSPDFNIFNEQGISELMQLGHLGMARFGRDMANLVRANLAKNPSYQMTNAEAQKYVDDFIQNIGDNTLDASREADFDKFLTSLTKLRINSPDGIMPEKAVDFILSQSMRSDSLINAKKDKYAKVPERAIEDLAKIDNLRRNDVNYVNSLYIVRDYIKRDGTAGLHSGNVITIKREQISKLPEGELDAIDTVFHENTHMTQDYRLERDSIDYGEYLMKKERRIRLYSADGENYYYGNYSNILIEIEAREVAARMTAAYVAKIAPKSKIADIADSVKQDVVDSLLDIYRVQENKYKEIEQKESTSYKAAIYKKDSDGKIRTINEIFDRRFNNRSFGMSRVLDEFIKTQYLAQFEYWGDGRKKTFSEQILTASQLSKDSNAFDSIRAVINYSGTAENADMFNTIHALNVLTNTISGDNSNRGRFTADIVKSNLPGMLDRYLESTNNYIQSTNKGTTEMVDVYAGIRNLLGKINSAPNADWVQGFNVPNSEGKSSVQLMENYCHMMKENFPNIDEVVRRLELQREQDRIKVAQEKAQKELEAAKRREQLRRGTYGRKKRGFIGGLFGYKQMANVNADVEGKRIVASYETNIRNSEQQRDTQEELYD